MKTFIAFQNKTHMQERMSSILWCANKCMDGYEQYYYINLSKLKKGDIVYNVSAERVLSVSFVEENAVDMKRPQLLEKTPWGDVGVGAKVQYYDLGRPLEMTSTLITKINELSADDESPYSDSLSPKHGYIFELSYPVHKLMVNRVLEYNNIEQLQGRMLSDKDIDLILNMEEKLAKCTDEAQKNKILNTDIINEILLPKKLVFGRKCTICAASQMDMLTLIYIKPWDACSITEKLDVSNTILLCFNHKFLFEKGLITFNDMGIIIISDRLNYDSYKPLNISLFTSLNLSQRELEYMKWHRENIFDK